MGSEKRWIPALGRDTSRHLALARAAHPAVAPLVACCADVETHVVAAEASEGVRIKLRIHLDVLPVYSTRKTLFVST